MTLRIAFDDQIFAFQEFGGISRYFVELATRFAARDDIDLRICAPLYRNRYLAEVKGSVRIAGRPLARIPRTDRIVELLSRSLTRSLIGRHRPHLVHETYYRARSAVPRGIPTVAGVYDMIPEKFPQYFPRTEPALRYKATTLQRASRVICISESTKHDLMELLRIPESKISVILLGVSRLPEPAPQCGEPAIPALSGAPFLLYVGKRDGYKNFEGLARAYAASPRVSAQFDLVCFGGGPFSTAEAETFRALGIPPHKLHQVGGGDAALSRLYRSAALFVYPSLYEGFGMPPLEAMAVGCPVACSNVASLPEVVGDAALTFDPNSTESIRAALETFAHDDSLRNQLIGRGARRIEAFSWDRCAAQTLELYRSIVG